MQPYLRVEVGLQTLVFSLAISFLAIVLLLILLSLIRIIKKKMPGVMLRTKDACNHGGRTAHPPQDLFHIVWTIDAFSHFLVGLFVETRQAFAMHTQRPLNGRAWHIEITFGVAHDGAVYQSTP